MGDHHRQVMGLAVEQANDTGAQPPADHHAAWACCSAWPPTPDRRCPCLRRDRRLATWPGAAAASETRRRARIIEQGSSKDVDPFTRMYLMPADAPVRYEYTDDDSIAAIAQRAGIHPVEAYLDTLDRSDGGRSSTGR
ncbi:hypothetical protein [Candidatus Neomicrothrix sp.]|uniref:hypothetical protein n=1 Tax=Candidatus Neomicrothrix sp. TaxID=2719034 RepID=UPI0025BC8435|nr:hypothetical protein [Candidatus Microthrix sp.]